ncbi:MAG TPA: ATP-grasp domain-containing protein [Mycobacteriales bacterium]|nr:ATP-grasp domain-containing protein [Mycobacteriales bacterium]
MNRISDRRFLTDHAASRGVSVPSVVPIRPRMSYRSLASQIGCPFIVKSVVGVSGKTCFRVDSQADLATVRAAARGAQLYGWRIMEGHSLNFHLCIGDEDLQIFEPTVQRFDDSDPLRPYRFTGNTFHIADDVSEHALQGAERELTKLARVLREAGFRGVAGADVVVTEHAQHVVDVNPRFQGSSLPLDLNLAALDRPRLATQHLRACSGIDLSAPRFSGHQERRSVGGQVFVAAPPKTQAQTFRKKNGIYSPFHGGLHYEGNFQVGQGLAEGHVLILDLPSGSCTRFHGATLARVMHAPGASDEEIVHAVRLVSEGRLRH